MNLNVSPKKVKCVVCLFRNASMCVSHDRSEEMSIPRYFAEDTDSSMQCEEYTVWELGFYVNDLAFRGVEFHVPFMTPAFKVVKIFLENLLRW